MKVFILSPKLPHMAYPKVFGISKTEPVGTPQNKLNLI